MDEMNGFIYVAFGATHAAMALHSLHTLKLQEMESYGSALVTDTATNDLYAGSLQRAFDTVKVVDVPPDAHRQIKIAIREYSPFTGSVYLDADTVIVRSPQTLFDLLKHADVAVASVPWGHWKGAKKGLDSRFGHKLANLPRYSSGVFSFNTDTSGDFFDKWSHFYSERGFPADEPSFLDAILATGCKVLAFDERWNCVTGPYLRQGTKRQVAVLHYSSKIPHRLRRSILDTLKAWTDLNECERVQVDEGLQKKSKVYCNRRSALEWKLREVISQEALAWPVRSRNLP